MELARLGYLEIKKIRLSDLKNHFYLHLEEFKKKLYQHLADEKIFAGVTASRLAYDLNHFSAQAASNMVSSPQNQWSGKSSWSGGSGFGGGGGSSGGGFGGGGGGSW